jgi:hypothetical protein
MRTARLACVLAGVSLPAGAVPGAAASSKPVAVMSFDLHDGRVFLPVRVNGKGPGDFQFDSAAHSSCVTKRFGERVALEAPLRATVSGAGDGSQTVAVAPDVAFGVGVLAFRAARVPLVDLDLVERGIGRRTDGLVGREFLERYVVAFDYGARTMTAFEPADFEYGGGGTVLPIEILMGGPVVRAVVRMPGRPPLHAKLLLDAPHAGPLVLTTAFVDRHGLLESARQSTPRLLPMLLGGVGGRSSLLVGRALSLEIGPYSFRSPVVALSRARAGALAAADIDGLVGSQIMGRFRIFYDLPRRRVMLEAGPRLGEAFVHDMSGLRLRAQTVELRAIEIFGVTEGTPAAAADLREGDVLLSVNERPVRASQLPELRELLSRPGTVRLKVKRGAEEKVVVLELRPLV